ncbi:MAG: AzlD domain-containing protein [Treponema sp.]|jgi:branched-subunit amino acid transport protein AzlD|nr:AzlD domain-containing protein [Treponema sp.]
MMVSIPSALILTVLMGAVIFFCRVLPFLFFRDRQDVPPAPGETFGPLLEFVEKLVPPVAMTVLAFNAISVPFTADFPQGLSAFIAAGFTALVHLWKRNSLFSICGGTMVYMLIEAVLPKMFG